MNFFKSIWSFFGNYQTPRIRILHILTLLMVLNQILISNWMNGTSDATIPAFSEKYFFTWMHIAEGIMLLFLAIALIYSCFKEKGIKNFYPYLWGNFSQIHRDIKLLFSKHLPENAPQGLAAAVQGLGLGALLIVILSGLTWLILWIQGSPLAPEAKSLHQSLTILIELYIYGHGGLGILHFIIWYKNSAKNPPKP